jgi:AcrR family transcriptional regulator
MSRKKTIDEAQLFQETEKLIMESGYAEFHFKALAERLGVARSTIYNYYPKKEELVTSYMVRLLKRAVQNMDEAFDAEYPVKQLIRVWSRYANMHQMLQIMPYINQKATPKVEENIRVMYTLFGEMKSKIHHILNKEQESGRIREDIHMATMTGLLMATVQIPVHHNNPGQWVDEVYELVMTGCKG